MSGISKATREAAILICDVLASSTGTASNVDTACSLGLAPTGAEWRLSMEAWHATWGALPMSERDDRRAVEAEAAALLRDGWCPGDEVERIGGES